jgi:hypothetical protein
VLFITHRNSISSAQIYPFFLFKREIEKRYGVELQEECIEHFEQSGRASRRAEIVVIQPWFDISVERLNGLLDRIRSIVRPERTIFLDSFAPSDLRLAATLGDQVDLYIKKHALRDRTLYGRPTRGDTNLTDYYSRRYNVAAAEVTFSIPDGFLNKLMIGPGFVSTPELVPLLVLDAPLHLERRIDVHARLGSAGVPWYQLMREEALRRISTNPKRRLVTRPGAPRWRYLTEMARAKICFSPFGYGEVAWRDCEAVALGALLLKPDMSHLELEPDVFIPNQTYVPISWDFEDLESKVEHLVAAEDERKQIAAQAHAQVRDYWREARFVPQMSRMFE